VGTASDSSEERRTGSLDRLTPSRRFLYDVVARELRRRISVQVYRPGVRIPSERELAREFKVSGITIRRAIRDLSVEGLLVSRQGLGVFVTDTRRIVRSLGRGSRTSVAEEMRRAGVEPGIKELSWSMVAAEERIAGRLAVDPGTLLYRLEKIVLADAEPVGIDIAYLPRPLGETMRHEVSAEFLFPILLARGVPVDHIDFQIEVSAVSPDQGPLLGLPVGFPLLVVRYTPIGANGAPILTGDAISRADRFVYEFCVHPALHRPHPRGV
jgi:GntR family transcriptional regulator